MRKKSIKTKLKNNLKNLISRKLQNKNKRRSLYSKYRKFGGANNGNTGDKNDPYGAFEADLFHSGNKTVGKKTYNIDPKYKNNVSNKMARFLFNRNYPGVYKNSVSYTKDHPSYVSSLNIRKNKGSWQNHLDDLETTFQVIDSNSKKMKFIQVGFFIVIALGIFLGLPFILFKNFVFPGSEKVINTDSSSTDEEKKSRVNSRGFIASTLTSVIMGAFNGMIDSKSDISASTSTALIGMFYGGTVGFIADNVLGSDGGLKTMKENFFNGIGFGFGTLATGRYVRYLLTIIFDTFVSMILFKPLYLLFLRTKTAFEGSNILKGLGIGSIFGGDEFPSFANAVASTIIGMTTFNAYANQTRFYWAYPDPNLPVNSLIDTNTMLLVTAVMSMVFLISNTQVIPGEKGINHPKNKVIIVVGLLAITTIIGMAGVSSPTMNHQIQEKLLKDSNGKLLTWDFISKFSNISSLEELNKLKETQTNTISDNSSSDISFNQPEIDKITDIIGTEHNLSIVLNKLKDHKLYRVRLKTDLNKISGKDEDIEGEEDVDVVVYKEVLVDKNTAGEDSKSLDPSEPKDIRSPGKWITGLIIFIFVTLISVIVTMKTSSKSGLEWKKLTGLWLGSGFLIPFVFLGMAFLASNKNLGVRIITPAFITIGLWFFWLKGVNDWREERKSNSNNSSIANTKGNTNAASNGTRVG